MLSCGDGGESLGERVPAKAERDKKGGVPVGVASFFGLPQACVAAAIQPTQGGVYQGF